MDAPHPPSNSWNRRWAAEDLTARARIRDAALEHFAEHGTTGATLRTIAEAAGVSAGLVRHHFGSKDGLRDACDAYMLEFLRGEVRRGVVDRELDNPEFIAAFYQAAPPVMRYLARGLVEGSPAASALFDDMVTLTEGVLHNDHPAAGGADLRARAAVLTAMKLGVTVLHDHLARALGTQSTQAPAAETLPRISQAVLDLLAPAAVGQDVTKLARSGLDRYQAAGAQEGAAREEHADD